MGCTSDAGKSFLVTALCRHFANRGLKVAPFKAQNMSNNAAITPDGFEIGRAQYLQALAARAVPQARMNPVLLKPSAETYSQVIVLGRYAAEISRKPWLERKEFLWPSVRDSLHSLLADYEQVVIEGAGSPAEINLRESDIVNMRVALECQAEVYLVADIDRGGAFAHLLGTWLCLEPSEQALVKGFILNKFRGDPTLLGNATAWLQEKTGVPTVALVPYTRHALPEEDSFFHRAAYQADRTNIALVVYPYASNLDEFDPLLHQPGVNVVPVRNFERLDRYQAILLPGSKNTAESLRFLQTTGLDREILAAAATGQEILGICGGLQMLGHTITDPHGLESGDIGGLGLLDVRTELLAEKSTRQRELNWQNTRLRGYEIHHGQTQAGPRATPFLPEDLGWQQDHVSGVYLHGLFENGAFLEYFLERLGWRGQAVAGWWPEEVDRHIERVAGLIPASGWQI
jgi:adenosylcobyric acid synthase